MRLLFSRLGRPRPGQPFAAMLRRAGARTVQLHWVSARVSAHVLAGVLAPPWDASQTRPEIFEVRMRDSIWETKVPDFRFKSIMSSLQYVKYFLS